MDLRRSCFCLLLLCLLTTPAFAGATERVSLCAPQGNADSVTPAISADGQFVAFPSDACNFTPDGNGVRDIFVHDRESGTIELVGVSPLGQPAISGDGRFVAFPSDASLVPGDTNFAEDVFVRDRQAGTTERVSVNGAGEEGDSSSSEPSISADGRFVAFSSYATNLVPDDTNGRSDIFVRDRQAGATERVSVSTAGNEGDGHSQMPSISADGRFVAFASPASTLVADDSNSATDVFVRDRQTGVTERVSVSSAGDQGDGTSSVPSISADGRFVAFISYATNLVPDDSNGRCDIFVHDRQTGTTERVSVSTAGDQGDHNCAVPSISADGRFVAFTSYASNLVPDDTNGKGDIFVRDRQASTTERVSIGALGEEGNQGSQDSSISADGRFVAFASNASNLVAGDTNGHMDIFIRDRNLTTTERVGDGSPLGEGNGASGDPSIGADMRFVAYQSEASNLVPDDTNDAFDVFIYDRDLAITESISVSVGGGQGNGESRDPSISADGDLVAFISEASDLIPGDTNGWEDVFVRERSLATTERVSVSSAGGEGDYPSQQPCVSADGRFVAFSSAATNLVPDDTNGRSDIFVRDRQAGATELVSVSTSGDQGDGHSYSPSISADGRFVAFASYATDLVADDTNGNQDIFVRDRQTGTTEIVSASTSGDQGDGHSYSPSISADGRFVAFVSYATTLVADDTNGARDIFVHDRQLGTTERVSVSTAGNEGDGHSQMPSISADGRFVAFSSDATNLVSGDTNGRLDTFVHDRHMGATERVSVSTAGEQGNQSSYEGSISGDGRYVAFSSLAANLVPDDTNNRIDVFLRDRWHALSLTGTGNGSIEVDGVPHGLPWSGAAAPDSTVVLEAVPDSGWVFLNWSGDLTGSANPDSVTMDTSKSVTANFIAHTFSVSANPPSPATVASGGTTSLSAAFSDSGGHSVASWSWDDGGAGGGFTPSAGVQDPTYTAPINTTDSNLIVTLTVQATCDGPEPLGDSDSTTVTVQPVPHTFSVYASVDPTAVPSGGTASLTANSADSRGHSAASWAWDDGGAGGSFAPSAGVQNPTYTAPANDTGAEIVVHLTVAATCDGPDPLSDSDTVDLTVRPVVTFSDVPFDHWAHDAIQACVEAGIVYGYPDGMYRPNQVVHRDAMAVFISRALCMGGSVPDGPETATFDDVPTDHWAYDHVEYAVTAEVVAGYTATRYMPDLSLSRAQMAVFIARAKGWVLIDDDMTTAPELFPDIPAGFWAGTAIEACVDNDVVLGYPDGRYRPATAVSRDQMAVYIARAFELL